MDRIKLTKNLYLDEYMPTDVYKKYGAKCARLIDSRVVAIDQAFRDRYGIIFINMPGLLENRGFRPISYYVKKGQLYSQSQHKYGRASDKHFKDVTVDEVYIDILKSPKKWIELGMTTVENIRFTHKDKTTTGWLHTDCRMPESAYVGKIRIVNP